MPAGVAIEELVALLEANEHYSVPYEVRRGTARVTPTQAAEVAAAVDDANLAATRRVPTDPTWSTAPDLVAGNRLRGELSKGLMTDVEVRAWFADLAAALEPSPDEWHVRPVVEGKKPPNVDAWALEGPPSWTAFLFFTPDLTVPAWERRLPAQVVSSTAVELLAWSRVPNGSVVLSNGVSEWVAPPGRAVEEYLAAQTPEESLFGVRQVCRKPRRMRLATFQTGPSGTLQVLDDAVTVADALAALIEGITVFAPWLDHAVVRLGQTLIPSLHDTQFSLGRMPTEVERAMAGRAHPLMATHLGDAYVVQLITDHHLAHASWTPFDVTPLGHGRHLARARELEPWLAPGGPPPAVLDEARAGLMPLLLTPELISELAPRQG